MSNNLPAFINIQTVRNLWHAGTGTDGTPEWDRYQMVKDEIGKLGLLPEAEKLESEAARQAGKIWEKTLQKR
jgi:hypothetical protein